MEELEVEVSKKLNQDDRLELIKEVYQSLKVVRKKSKKEDLSNIATSYHNKIVELEQLFKRKEKDPEESSIYDFINLYLNDNLLLGIIILNNYSSMNAVNRLLVGRRILDYYIQAEKNIRYFSIEKDINQIIDNGKQYFTDLQQTLEENDEDFDVDDIIDIYNMELKELGINIEIPSVMNKIKPQKIITKTKHIRKN